MPASTPLYLVLTSLAAGIGLAMSLVPPARTSRGYGTTMTWVALAGLVAALAYDFWFRLGPAARAGLDSGPGALAAGCQAAAGLVLIGLLARLRRDPMPGRGAPVAAAVLSGAGVVMTSVLVLPAGTAPAVAWLGAVAGLAGAAVLGTALSAMLLGHFYLVVPGLSIDPFMRLSRAFVAAVACRAVLDGVAILMVGPGRFWSASGVSGTDPVSDLLLGIVPLLMRVLFGLAGALVLGVMTVRTVAIRSTQSATGIPRWGTDQPSVDSKSARITGPCGVAASSRPMNNAPNSSDPKEPDRMVIWKD